MSEQDRREFLAAEGVDDWVVLHGGATAVFSVPPGRIGAACRIGRAYPGIEDSGTLLTIADDRAAVTSCRTAGMGPGPEPVAVVDRGGRTRNLYQKGRAGAPAAS